jgi:hypothetical protein
MKTKVIFLCQTSNVGKEKGRVAKRAGLIEHLLKCLRHPYSLGSSTLNPQSYYSIYSL